MCCKKYVLLLISVFWTNWAHGFEFEYTSQSIAMMTFFHEEMESYMTILDNGHNIPFCISVYSPMFYDADTKNTPLIFNVFLGSFMRVNKHFLTFLNASMALQHNQEPDESADNFLLDGGLVFQGRIGTIGLFVGHNRYLYNLYAKNVFDSVHNMEEKVVYSLLPLINTAEYPIFGYIINKIAGYINTDQNNEINYSIKLISQPLSISSVTINSFTPYYFSRQFSLYAKNNLYGLLTNININDKFDFFVDIGYKDYFDIMTVNSFYEDTFYLRFGFPIETVWKTKVMWYGLSFYIDKQHPFPRIGYIYQVNNSRAIFEIGFYRTLCLLVAYRINLREFTKTILRLTDL
jgi:hypothetical protein